MVDVPQLENVPLETTPIEPTPIETLPNELDIMNQEMNVEQLEMMTRQTELLEIIASGASTLMVYGIIVVPFIIVCTMLWWFFKQFLYKF